MDTIDSINEMDLITKLLKWIPSRDLFEEPCEGLVIRALILHLVRRGK
jgi:hypothetical protein